METYKKSLKYLYTIGLIFSTLNLAQLSFAQSWNQLGENLPAGFSGTIKVAPNGEIYYATRNNQTSRTQVLKLNGSAWQQIGGTASTGTAWQNEINFVGNTPILALRDYAVPTSSLSLRLLGTTTNWLNTWNCTGCTTPNLWDVHFPQFMVSHNPNSMFFETPILAVQDGYASSHPHFATAPPQQHYPRPSILVWLNNTWVYLGGKDVSKRITQNPVNHLSIIENPRNLTPSISFVEGGSIKALEYDRNANSWLTKASLITSAKNLKQCFFQGKSVMFYVDSLILKAVTQSGNSYVPLGGGIVNSPVHMGQQDWIQNVSCGVFKEGDEELLFVGYRRSLQTGYGNTYGEFAVSMYDGQSWQTFPYGGFSDREQFISMAIDSLSRRVLVALSDFADNKTQHVYWHSF